MKLNKLNPQVFVMAFLATSLAEAANVVSAPEGTEISGVKLTEIEKFWTPENMKAAVPFPSPELSKKKIAALLGGRKSSVKPKKGTPKSPSFGTPVRADVGTSPYAKGGKLFFTRDNKKYTCSAQFVGATTVLMTAAHCSRAIDGTWSTNVYFVRAYSDGGGKSFAVSCISTTNGWVTGGDTRAKWDYSFLKTAAPSDAGNMELRTGIPDSTFEAIGYPGNFDANRFMYKVAGSKGAVSGGVVEMQGNPMRNGNSGGAWAAGNYAVGLNSFHLNNAPNSEWGPYFDANTTNLHQFANRGCKN